VADDLTVEELLQQMEVDPAPINSIIINGKEGSLVTHLVDGDQLGLFPLNMNGSK